MQLSALAQPGCGTLTPGCSLPGPGARSQQECALEVTPAGSKVLPGQDTSPHKLLLLREPGHNPASPLSLSKVRTVTQAQKKHRTAKGICFFPGIP